MSQLCLAGEHWQSADGDELTTFAPITNEANRQLSSIQPRVPVIIEKAGRYGWVKSKATSLWN